MNKDLTVGNPEQILWRFCLPLFGSVIFQQLYNLADSWVAGRFIGENALAAVGNSYEITLIFLAFAMGCNIGCSVITSRYFGSKDYATMKSAVSTSMITSAIFCFMLMLIGLLGGAGLLHLINTPTELFDDSLLYLLIYTRGLPFVFFYNISTGIFSALGDSKTPFYFLVVSSLSNIAVDIYFVKSLHMGVAGVAWATFLCQGVSCVLALTVIMRRLQKIQVDLKPALFTLRLCKNFLLVAVPSILQQSFISIGNIILQSVINSFGAGVIAGYAAGVKINNLVITSFTTIGNGISNYASQNIGAEKFDRIPRGARAGIKFVWCISLPFFLLYFLFPKVLLRFFMDTPSADALRSGVLYLRILSPFYFVVSVKLAVDGILRGATKMKEFMISTFTDLILRVLLSVVLSATFLGYTGIWCSWPIGWSIGTALSVYFYKKCIRKA